MYFDQDGVRVVSAFVECIAEHGVTRMTADHIARKLGSSRAALYRQFGSWPQMVAFGYEAMLEWVDAHIPWPQGDRRAEFEKWWADVMALLGSSRGRGMLALRALTESHLGADELAQFELARMPGLARWCAPSRAAALATWCMLRTAAAPKVEAHEAMHLRECVWMVIAGDGTNADLPELEALHQPLT